MSLHRITLVGFRASGKSTVGRLLAARLAWPFVDADTAVEARLGMSIAAYFKQHGEPAFREHEAAALATCLAGDGPLVLATGGGAVVRPENRDLLRARGGLVVYLEASAAVIQERLRHHTGGRPSLTGASVIDEVPALLATREPFYREVAGLVLSTGLSPAEVADRLGAEILGARPR
jgi:shikimate kinase